MTAVIRRARVALGTLCEIGVVAPAGVDPGGARAIEAGFAVLAEVEALLSRQRPDSALSRLNASPPQVPVDAHPHLAAVLARAGELFEASAGLFDASGGTAPPGDRGFVLARSREGMTAMRSSAAVRLSLDGIAKGHAVDRAVDAMRAQGATAGWVNAGGDLAAFGEIELPVTLRHGARQRTMVLRDAALATSQYGRGRHVAASTRLWSRRRAAACAVTVTAPHCILADALTKVAAIDGRRADALLAELGARIVALH